MTKTKDYFQQAQSWADDKHASIIRSKARYQAGFFVAMGLNIAASMAIATLANMQTLIPIAVHHYEHGVTTVEPVSSVDAPINRAQVESDIVRYITNRESYDLASYRAQFDLVNLLSSSSVSGEYARLQSSKNPDSPIVQLADKYSRRIHVYSINFLDNVLKNTKDLHKNHQNLAEVVFTLTDVDKATGNSVSQNYNALISWQYVKPSDSPDVRWKNFDGFQVMSYQKQIRNEVKG